MPLTTVVGLQWGDEGKGRVIDLLPADVYVRMNGGPNAGHTIRPGLAVHQVPPGFEANPGAELVIAAGSLVDPDALVAEVQALLERGFDVRGRLVVSHRAHVIEPGHRTADRSNVDRLGSTGTGNGPAYADKYARTGLRLEQADVALRRLRDVGIRVEDTEDALRDRLEAERDVVLLVAHGTMLDVSLGTYPYVTSSHCTAAGALVGAGLSPADAEGGVVVGVVKAYTTRVAAGPLRGESTPWSEEIAERGAERGTTTGRVRRVGPLDLGQLYYAARVNRPTLVVLNKVDVLADGRDIPVIHDAWEESGSSASVITTVPGFTASDLLRAKADPAPHNIPEGLRMLISQVKAITGAEVMAVGIGPGREDVIDLRAGE